MNASQADTYTRIYLGIYYIHTHTYTQGCTMANTECPDMTMHWSDAEPPLG